MVRGPHVVEHRPYRNLKRLSCPRFHQEAEGQRGHSHCGRLDAPEGRRPERPFVEGLQWAIAAGDPRGENVLSRGVGVLVDVSRDESERLVYGEGDS